MAITNLQQARQMYQTGQRVAKTLDGSRPGYRGSSYGSPSRSSSSGPAGGASAGGNYGGNRNTSQSYGGSGSTARERAIERNQTQRTPTKTTTRTGPTNIHGDGGGTTPYTYIGGKKYDVTPTTRNERDRATLKQQILNQTTLGGNRIDRFGNTKKSPFRQGSGLGSLIMGGLGMLMGIPGLGLLTGGFNRLKGGLDTLNTKLGDFREGTTGYRTQAEYEAARNQRQLQKRLDNLYSRKNLGKGYSQKNIDMLEAMGLSPTTPQNQDNARGSNLRNILNNDVNNLDLEQGNLNNISSLIAATNQGLLEAPGDNLPVIPNRNINYNRIQGYADEYPNLGMEEVVGSNTIPTINGVPMINTGSVYDNLNKDSYTYPADTTVQNTVPVSNYDVRDDFYTGDRLTEFAMENGVITKNDQRLVAPFRLAKGGIASL